MLKKRCVDLNKAPVLKNNPFNSNSECLMDIQFDENKNCFILGAKKKKNMNFWEE